MTPAIPNPHVFHQYQSLCSVVSLSCTFLVIIHTLSTPWCFIPLRCSLSVLRGGSCQETDPHLRQETPSNREDHLMNPPARRSGEKFKSISLLSFCHPPQTKSASQPFINATNHSPNNTSTFSPEEASSTVAYASTTAWVSESKEDWIGPGGSNQAAPSTAYQCANKRLVYYGAKNQTIQLLTSLAAQSLSSVKFMSVAPLPRDQLMFQYQVLVES